MLGVFGSPQWRTVTGGSREYVAAVAARLARRPHRHQGHLGPRDRRRRRGHRRQRRRSRRTTPSSSPRTPPRRWRCSPSRPRSSARCSSALPYSQQHRAAAHRHLAAADARRRPGVLELPPPGRRAAAQVTVTYDLTRLQRLATDTHYLVTLGGEDLVDPATVIDRMEYEHPLYTPDVGRRPAPAAGDRHRPDRLRRRLPRLGLPRGRRALRAGRRRAPRPALDRARRRVRRRRPGRFETTIRHTRRTPFKRTFEHRSHTLARRPRRPARPRPARPVRGARPPRLRPTARSAPTSRRSSPRHDVDLGTAAAGDPDGRQPAGARPLLQPDQRLLVLRRPRRARPASVVEVHNTYGDRHAYLVHPDEQGRAQTDKAMYVSPFHGVDGTYDLAVPIPTDRLHVAVTLRDHDGRATRRPSAPASPAPAATSPSARPLGAALRGSAADPGPRHLAVGAPAADPPPTHPPSGRRPMTLEKNQPETHRADPNPSQGVPPLEQMARGPRTAIAAAVARRLFRAAVDRLARHRASRSRRRPPPRPGRAGHEHPPARRVLRPARPRRPDRLRRGLPDRRLGRRGPRRLPHRARRRDRDADPRAAAAAARLRDAAAARAPAQHRGQQPGQHRAPLRPVQRAVRALPRRDAELLLRALRHLPVVGRAGTRLRR